LLDDCNQPQQHHNSAPTDRPAAGLWINDYTRYCSPSSGRCYLYNRTADNAANHKLNCQRLGGYLAAYNNAEEQYEVELWFVGNTTVMTGTPYIGVELAGNGWYLADGSWAGGGTPSEAPYAHWWAALLHLAVHAEPLGDCVQSAASNCRQERQALGVDPAPHWLLPAPLGPPAAGNLAFC
jgi:hypothetical protein